MKKFLLILSGLIIGTAIMAQVPMGITHQAVIRDANNELLINQEVGIRVSILKGIPDSLQTMYVETHIATTNANGLLTFIIGKGQPEEGLFEELELAVEEIIRAFVKVEVDPEGGTNYTIEGITQLYSVPYALHAKTAKGTIEDGKDFGEMLFWDGDEWARIEPPAEDTQTYMLTFAPPLDDDDPPRAIWEPIAIILRPPSITTSDFTCIDESTVMVSGEATFTRPFHAYHFHIIDKGFVYGSAPDPTFEVDEGVSFGSGEGAFSDVITHASPFFIRPYVKFIAFGSVNVTKYGDNLTIDCSHMIIDCPLSVTFDYLGSTVMYDVIPRHGLCWMDRNLGASRAPLYAHDDLGYGDLFQWGRLDDGHQERTSHTTATLSPNNDPMHDFFITNIDLVTFMDWRAPQNDELWQGTAFTNNPCPDGWRVPTESELNAERSSWVTPDDAFDSPLRWPFSGQRMTCGDLSVEQSSAAVWSSTILGKNAIYLEYSNLHSLIDDRARAHGMSVRCVLDSLADPNIYNLNLNVNPPDAGSVTGAGSYQAGDLVEISATPVGDWEFVNWTGDTDYIDDHLDANTTVEMPGYNIDITANFEVPEYSTVSFFVVDQLGTPVADAKITITSIGDKKSQSHKQTPMLMSSRAPTTINTENKRNLINFEVSNSTKPGIIPSYHSEKDQGEWIKYWESGVNDNALGLNSPGSWQAAIRWMPDDLADYEGFSVTKIRVYMNDEPLDASAIIWQGNINNPVVQVNQAMMVANQDWVEVELLEPYLIDTSQELWIGWEIGDTDGVFPAAFEESSQYDQLANLLIFLDNPWGFASDYGFNVVWNIEAYVIPIDTDILIIYTDANGHASFDTNDGDYYYTIQKEGHTSASGNFSVDGESVTIDAILFDEEIGEVYYSLSLFSDPENAGLVTGAGEYLFGEEVSINATANSGWEFVEWTGDIEHLDDENSAEAMVTMPADNVTFTAVFEEEDEDPDFTCGYDITFTYRDSPATYGTIERFGLCWMDRNLGASRVPLSEHDDLGYGDLFQWGRLDDGHQARTSGTTATLSPDDDPMHDFFIINTNPATFMDWRNPQSDVLWQGTAGTNNPCPTGWRLPTATELNTERLSWPALGGAFGSPLKWPISGQRMTGGYLYLEQFGVVWSSTVSSQNAFYMEYSETYDLIGDEARANGMSVRCVRFACDFPPAHAPEATDATSITTNTFIANWSVVDDAVWYTLEVSLDPGFPEYEYMIFNVVGTSHTVDGLSPATTYFYRVNAINYCGTTEYSNIVSVTTTSDAGFTCGDEIIFTYSGEEVTYGTILRNGLCWLDRNLGAVPMPFVPADDAMGNTDTRLYGDLFQWGRLDDGHQDRTSTTTSTLSTSDVPGHSDFIRRPTGALPYDWREDNNNNRWNADPQENNPCPPGWRVPTEAELNAERLSWDSNNSAGAYDSTLKWPVGGHRFYNGLLKVVGSYGNVWSSSVSDTNARSLYFFSGSAGMYSSYRVSGMSVRCVLDL